ncbi:ferredoxin [Luteipulveratus mongoliensis]|uniref:Ferredoxin n=1 Tax=Luteipulveratus mongoliensis TaxID=571913 RepID=A0A0K1JLC9_9MICO|nr:ferredoxin [Luteipulveratus mongoliensis]AKU17380.1 ferredoxin [Luteipulveratus mongoliensis]
MKIVADRDRCEGLGMCEAMADHFFEVGEDGFVHILDEEPAEEYRTELSAAVDACPVLALTLQG